MRAFALLLGVSAAFLTGAAGPAGSSSDVGASGSVWVATDLGNVGRAGVTVADINDRGQVVGGLRTRSGGSRGFVWRNGLMRELGRPLYAGARRINERGQIIGTSSSASDREEHAVTWVNGKMIDLPPAGSVQAINERGQILGHRYGRRGNDGAVAQTPVIWENGKVRDLFAGGSAQAINDRGQVVGGTKDGRAVVWQNGRVTSLGPGVAMDINERGEVVGQRDKNVVVWRNATTIDLGPGTPVAINDSGQVIGVRGPPGHLHAFLWQRGTMTDLGTLGGRWSIPTAISNRGQIVGYSLGSGGVQYAFLWHDGTMIKLNSPKGNARTRAIAINENNQIVGDNCFEVCDRRAPRFRSKFAVIWTLRQN
jgi:probable HAF family extracellular repeat protein